MNDFWHDNGNAGDQVRNHLEKEFIMKRKVHSHASYLVLASFILAMLIPFESFAQHPRHHRHVVHVTKAHPKRVKHVVVHKKAPINFIYNQQAYQLHNGKFYERHGKHFVQVRPIIGMRVPAIPSQRKVIVHRNEVFYSFRGVYYRAHPRGGFVVSHPPRIVR